MKKILAGLTLLLALQTLHADPSYTVYMLIAGSKNDSIVTQDGVLKIETKEGNVVFHGIPTALSIPSTQGEQREYLSFPISYDPARRIDSNAAIPMFPKTFTKVDVGWKITTCVEAEREGIVAIRGEATYTKPIPESQAAFGEETGPLYGEGTFEGKKLIENRSISFSTVTTTTHFYLFARSGKSYTIPLKQGTETVNAAVTCTVADSTTQSVAQR